MTGSAGHAYFENLRIAQHECGSHVSAETPAVNADAAAVYVRQAFQVVHSFYLSLPSSIPKCLKVTFFELQSPVTATAVVEREHDITLLAI